MKDKKDIRGASITIVIGSYGGFYLSWNKGCPRICLGWIAITFYNYDLENAIEFILNKNK